jgi:hypothetical protein
MQKMQYKTLKGITPTKDAGFFASNAAKVRARGAGKRF